MKKLFNISIAVIGTVIIPINIYEILKDGLFSSWSFLLLLILPGVIIGALEWLNGYRLNGQQKNK